MSTKRCELLNYICNSEDPDKMICGAFYGCCCGKMFNKASMYPYYKEGRDRIAKMISEIMPAVN